MSISQAFKKRKAFRTRCMWVLFCHKKSGGKAALPNLKIEIFKCKFWHLFKQNSSLVVV